MRHAFRPLVMSLAVMGMSFTLPTPAMFLVQFFAGGILFCLAVLLAVREIAMARRKPYVTILKCPDCGCHNGISTTCPTCGYKA